MVKIYYMYFEENRRSLQAGEQAAQGDGTWAGIRFFKPIFLVKITLSCILTYFIFFFKLYKANTAGFHENGSNSSHSIDTLYVSNESIPE